MLTKSELKSIDTLYNRLENEPCSHDDVYWLIDLVYQLDQRADQTVKDLEKAWNQELADANGS